jgi:lipopolysaccharide/colanic/teichoic acid biosynthesis glycosyltransferase
VRWGRRYNLRRFDPYPADVGDAGVTQRDWRSDALIALGDVAKRGLDVVAAALLLLVLMPLIGLVAAAIRLDSRGPAFFRCRRVGFGGRQFRMLKFRKMVHDAGGGALTAPEDARFTRFGRLLAKTKLDEIPQLWNVLKGDMSLVGPRPEDAGFVKLRAQEYRQILRVRPGITGLSQLAFARESEILDPNDRHGHYVSKLLPAKARIDCLYVSRRTLGMDLKILFWTAAAVLLRLEVAVHRQSGRLTRRRPRVATEGQHRGVVTTS